MLPFFVLGVTMGVGYVTLLGDGSYLLRHVLLALGGAYLDMADETLTDMTGYIRIGCYGVVRALGFLLGLRLVDLEAGGRTVTIELLIYGLNRLLDGR